jgi:hypothetical protein
VEYVPDHQVLGCDGDAFVIVNGAPLGAPANPDAAIKPPCATATTSSLHLLGYQCPAVAVALSVELADGSATVTATNWVLDMTTFSYSSKPFADAE